jgi:hypothetical protein
MHIPKTSGSSLIASLAASLAPGRVVRGYDRSIFGAFAGFDTLAPEIREMVLYGEPCAPSDTALLAGHMSLSTLRAAYPPSAVLTVLREPVSRLLSHWLYWRHFDDGALAGWGGWADYVRKSRGSFATFLGDPTLACQTDNLAVRMLLWPNRQIPEAGFIDPASDRSLLRDAEAALGSLDFVDVVENPGLEGALRGWLGGGFVYARENEAAEMPAAMQSPLHREFTARAQSLLHQRSRLDLLLWRRVCARHAGEAGTTDVRERTIMAKVARYGALLGG